MPNKNMRIYKHEHTNTRVHIHTSSPLNIERAITGALATAWINKFAYQWRRTAVYP